MHQRRRTGQSFRKRILVGSMVAMSFGMGTVAVSSDPVEVLCQAYTDSDPMWYLLGCWRFPAR